MRPSHTLTALAVGAALLVALGLSPGVVASESGAGNGSEKTQSGVPPSGSVMRIRRAEFLDSPVFAEPRQTYGIAERFLKNLCAPVKACPVMICGGSCRDLESGCRLPSASGHQMDDGCARMCSGTSVKKMTSACGADHN